MVNNQTPRVIVKVFADYDYIYDCDYSASGNRYYDWLRITNTSNVGRILIK